MLEELETAAFFDLEGFPFPELFHETQYPWEALQRLDTFFPRLERKKDLASYEGVHFVNPDLIFIAEGCTIEPGALITGPCWIGEGCQIRHGAYLRGFVVAGPGAVVGHSTEIKHSILLNGAMAAHFNYVGNSILGRRSNLGAGVKCANLRLDHQEVVIRYKGRKLTTGMKKLGAIVGDEAQLGCNAVTNPGTLIGKKAVCFPCLSIHGVIPPHARIESNERGI